MAKAFAHSPPALSLVEESQTLFPGTPVSSTYCPSQNCLIAFLKDGTLSALDISTGAILHRTEPIADTSISQNSSWFCCYVPSVDRLVVSDGVTICARKDHNGVFLLDSVLQIPGSEELRIELPLPEVPLLLVQLKNASSHGNEKPSHEKVAAQLMAQVSQHMNETKGWQKAAKWRVAVLHISALDMLEVLTDIFSSWPRNSSGAARAYPLMSLLRDRLQRLVAPGTIDLSTIPDPVGGPRGVNAMMGSELHRLKTFRDWPQMNHKWALPSPMATAGFYYCPSASGDDRVLCFSCGVCLAYWEPTDEPWSEHERHGGSQCRFIKGSATKNVVLASSLATAVATPIDASNKSEKTDTTVHHHHHMVESVLVSCSWSSVTINDLQLEFQEWATFTTDAIVRLLVSIMRDGFDLQFGAGDGEMITSLLKVDEPAHPASLSSSPGVPACSGDPAAGLLDGSHQSPQEGGNSSHTGSLLDQLLTDTNSSRAVIHGLCRLCGVIRKGLAREAGTVGAGDVDISVEQSVLFSAMRHCGLNQPAQPVPMGCDSASSAQGTYSMWTVPQWPYHCTLSTADVLVLATVGARNSATKEQVLLLVNVSNSPLTDTGKDESEMNGVAATNPGLAAALSEAAAAAAAATGDLLDVDDSVSGTKVMNHLSGGMNYDGVLKDPISEADFAEDFMAVYDTQPLLSASGYTGALSSIATQTPMPTSASGEAQDSLQTVAATTLISFGTVFEECEDGFAVQSLLPVGNRQAIILASTEQLQQQPQEQQQEDEPDSCSDMTCSCWYKIASDSVDQKSSCVMLYTASSTVGSGALERTACVYLGSTSCTVTSICTVPTSFVKGVDMSSSSSCLLACSLSCDRLVIIGVPSLAVVAVHKLSPSSREPALSTARTTSDPAVTGKTTAVGDSEQVSEDPVTVGTCTAAQDAATTSLSDEAATCDGTASEPAASNQQNCCDALQVPAAAAGVDAAPQSQPVVFYCAGREQVCVVKNCLATFFDSALPPDYLADAEVKCTSPVPAGVTKLDDELCRDLHAATVFEPCQAGPQGVRITPPMSWEEVSWQQLLRRQPQHLQQAGSGGSGGGGGGGSKPPVHSVHAVLAGKLSGKLGSNTSTPGTASPLPDSSAQGGLPWKTFCRVGNSCQTNGHLQIFEIVMPRQCPLARVDVKFRLKDSDGPPTPVLVTLLMDGGTSKGSVPQDPADAFPFTGSVVHDLIHDSGAVIISGPVSLHAGLEGLGPNGYLSLSPPSQVDASATRSTTFYLHIANMIAPGPGDGPATLNIESLKIAVLQWPDESSSLNPTLLPLSAMRYQLLHDRDLWRGLIAKVVGTDFDVDEYPSRSLASAAFQTSQMLAMDLLLWIAGMWSTHPNSPLLPVMTDHCESLVMTCFVHGGRTIAHHCAQLFLFLTGCFAVYGSDKPNCSPSPFEAHLCHIMLKATPLMLASAVRGATDEFLDAGDAHVDGDGDDTARSTGGAVYWFFVGLCSLGSDMPAAAVMPAIKPLLSTLLDVLQTKRVSADLDEAAIRKAHDLLSRRFDFHDMPLEPTLFDASAPTGPSLASPKLAPASNFSQGGNAPGGGGGGGGGGSSGIAGASAVAVDPMGQLQTTMSSDFFEGPAGPSWFPTGLNVPSSVLVSNPTASNYTYQFYTNPPFGGSSSVAYGTSTNSSHSDSSTSASSTSDENGSFSSTTEKFLRAVLFSSSVTGEEAAPLRQTSFPSLGGLLEVFPLPFTIHRHSNGVRAGANAETHISRLDSSDDRNSYGMLGRDISNATLDQVSSTFKRRALHERLVSPVRQPHTFLFDHINSGERHTIVLDLGAGVRLTDLIIYPCPQFSSLAVHVWDSHANERQAKRLAVCMDIASRSLVLSDISPQLQCQYIKIVLIGALGGSHTNGQLVIGGLYGTLDLDAVLSSDRAATVTTAAADRHSAKYDVICDAYSDLECRYSVSCEALEHHLERFSSDKVPISAHSQQTTYDLTNAYHQCCILKLQMNRLRHILASWYRLPSKSSAAPAHDDPSTLGLAGVLSTAPVCVLQVLAGHLVDTLMAVCAHAQHQHSLQSQQSDSSVNQSESAILLSQQFSPGLCEQVLKELCVHSTLPTMLPLNSGALILQACSRQPWWAGLLKSLIAEHFTTNSSAPITQQRVYLLICNFVNLSSPSVLPGITEACVDLLFECLAPLGGREKGRRAAGSLFSNVDSSLVTWLLLLISHFLDLIHEEPSGAAGETPRFSWDFIVPSCGTINQATANKEAKTTRARDHMHRRIKLHQAKIKSMGTGTSNFLDPEVGSDGKLDMGAGDMSMSNSPSRPSTPSGVGSAAAAAATAANAATAGNGTAHERIWKMEPKRCTEVLQRLMNLIEIADMSVSADMYILSCKVISCLSRCSSPPVSISSLFDRSSLLSMFQLCITAGRPSVASLDMPVGTTGMAAGWSGPWTAFALSGMFLDMMMAERVWISQVYSQFYSVDDPLAAASPKPGNANSSDSSSTSTSAGSSLVEASRHTLDGVCSMLNKLTVPQTASSSSSNMKLSSQIVSLKNKSQHLKAKLEAMKSSPHTSAFSGKLKEVDAKIDRLKTKALEIQRLHKAHGLSTAPSTSQSSTSFSRSLKISSEHDAWLEMSVACTAETALQSLVHCQHVSNMHMWRCPPASASASLGSSTSAAGGAGGDEQFSSSSLPATSLSEGQQSDSSPANQDSGSGRSTKATLDRVLRRACSVQFMLCKAFDSLFQSMDSQSDVESLLELWMQLNPTSGCAITFIGTGTLNLSPETIFHVLKSLSSRCPQVTVRAWSLLFQMLTSVCYLSPVNRQSSQSSRADKKHMSQQADGWHALLTKETLQTELASVLLAFLCQPSIDGGRHVGPWVVHLMENFLMLFVGVVPNGRDASASGCNHEQQDAANMICNFRASAYNLLLHILLDLLNADLLGQGGAVDAQSAFISFLATNIKFVTCVDSVILKIWRRTCTLAGNIGPTLNSAVFCSGGLSAKLEEKGKPVPLPHHQGYLSAVEPLMCNVMWLLLASSSVPIHPEATERVASTATSPTTPASTTTATGETQEPPATTEVTSRGEPDAAAGLPSDAAAGLPSDAAAGLPSDAAAGLPSDAASPLEAETGHLECNDAQPGADSAVGRECTSSDNLSTTTLVPTDTASDDGAAVATAAATPITARSESTDTSRTAPSPSTNPPSSNAPSAAAAQGDVDGVTDDPELVAHYFLADLSSMKSLVTCLNMCPWWQRPASLPSLSSLYASRFEDLPRLLYLHCQKNALDLAKQSHLFPSALMAVFVTLFQHSALACEADRSDDINNFVRSIICFLSSQTCVDSSVAPVLSSPYQNAELSEPVLLLILAVLCSPRSAIDFIENDGLAGLTASLMSSSLTQWDFQPSGVSQALRTVGSLSTIPALKRGAGREQESRAAHQDKEDSLVLKNFAPYGQISATPRVDGVSDSLDALLGHITPYRRARAANWSHRFSSSSPKWVSLTVQLPLPIILKVVQVTAHALSLANAPSCVVIEAARSPGGMLPLGCSVVSSGCGSTRMELLEPRIVTSVCIRLKRPVDSDSLSLTHIGIYGVATFSCSLSFSNATPMGKTTSLISSLPLTHVNSSALTWLHCLAICIQSYSSVLTACDRLGVSTSKLDGSATALNQLVDSPDLLRVLLQIFQSPRNSECHCLVEEILKSLAGLSEKFSTSLTRALLACAAPTPASFQPSSQQQAAAAGPGQTQMWSSFACGGYVTEEAALHLIYCVGSTRDQNLEARMAILLEWLCCVSSINISAAQLSQLSTCLPLRIQAVAASLFQMSNQSLATTADTLLTEELFRAFLSFSEKAMACDKSLGVAVRNALGCLTCIRPVLFKTVLSDISTALSSPPAQQQQRPSASIMSAIQSACAMAQSDECTKLLLKTDFLDHVVALIGSFLAKEARHQSDLDIVTQLLTLLTGLCDHSSVQHALGGDRAQFWRSLLSSLCAKPSRSRSRLSVGMGRGARQRKDLQAAALSFFSAVTLGNLQNSEELVKILCVILREEDVRPDAGFMRQVLVGLLLHSEKVRIVLCPVALSALSKSSGLFNSDAHRQQVGNQLHWPVGRGVLIREVSVCSSMTQLSETILPSKLPSASKASSTGGTATPTTAATESQSAASAASWKMFLKKYSGEELPYIDETDMWDLDVKWSNIVKSERPTTSTEESSPTTFVASLSFRRALLDPVLDSSASVADVAQLQPPSQRALSSRTVQLFYSLSGQNDRSSSSRIADVVPSAVIAAAAASASAASSESGLLGAAEEPAWQSFLLLQLFSKFNGLRTLADYIPSWYSNVCDLALSANGGNGGEDDGTASLVRHLPDYVPVLPPFDSSVWPVSTGRLPTHTLAALTLLLRLPHYAEGLLKHQSQAATLLRLLLGVPTEGVLAWGSSGSLCSLPTLSLLPFALLVSILQSKRITLDAGGFALRVEALNGGLLHFLLACLAHLSHADKSSSAAMLSAAASDKEVLSANPSAEVTAAAALAPAGAVPVLADPVGAPGMSKTSFDGKLYWAKGTGFGTGSTHSTWDVNQAVSRQKKEESHVTALLETLASLFDCTGVEDSEKVSQLFNHTWLLALLRGSCLLPLLQSYLCNDSVLDMSCHLVVNSAVLLLVRAISTCEPLSSLLLESHPSGDSVMALLTKMKNCLETYTLCLGKQKPGKSSLKSKGEASSAAPTSSSRNAPGLAEASNEGIAALVEDVYTTHQIVNDALRRRQQSSCDSSSTDGLDGSTTGATATGAVSTSDENEYYVSQMKLMQFGTHAMVEEDAEGVPHCVVDYGYKQQLFDPVSSLAAASRAQRLAQEMSTLATSLPLSSGSTVFVRCDEDRLDVMKVLITGPEDTPYFGGCFEFDVFFPGDYPQKPMKVNLATTGNQTVRFNPNLYNDGKVCLSVLNTWHGRPEEKWNAQTSSLLQVLVSIQSLILVPEPYFNEPGYERSRNTALGDQASLEYNANIKQATMKWAMLEQLRKTPAAFKDVIRRHFFLKQNEILAECEQWIADATQKKKRMHSYSSSHIESARRHLAQLKIEFAKLKDEPITEPVS